MSGLFRSPFYFLFVASIGFSSWALTFKSGMPDSVSAQQTNQESHFSSTAMPNPELYSVDMSGADQIISDEELLKELELSETEWTQKSEEPFSTSPAQVEEYELNYIDSYDHSVMPNDYMQIATTEPKIQFEEAKSCAAGKLAVENIINKSKDLTEWIKERPENSKLSVKCLTHVMNQFNLAPKSLAKCPSGPKSMPQRGGSKPCVTKSIVNVTYNAYMDVTECLGINPKSLLPKLSNESGFLINTLGYGLDAGVGQLTGVAIEETNKYFDRYLTEMAQSDKPACQRLMKSKNLLTKVSDQANQRCGLIAPPENPIKNIVYMAMLNRLNLENTKKKFENNDIEGKLKKLGLENVDMSQLIEIVALAGYNAGPGTSFNALNEYLDKRIKAKKKLTAEDFDFHNPKTAKDIDGQEKSVTQIARLYVNSPYIKKGDTETKIKIQRAKLLPEKIRNAYLLTFPEFMIYSQNNFDESQKVVTKNYKTIGAPGYLSFLAAKDKALRETFAEAGADPFFCSNPKFLKIK